MMARQKKNGKQLKHTYRYVKMNPNNKKKVNCTSIAALFMQKLRAIKLHASETCNFGARISFSISSFPS